MSLNLRWPAALVVMVLACAVTLLVVRPWRAEPPEYVHVGVVAYDDSEVVTLRDSLRLLRNELALKPRVVVLRDTVTQAPDTLRLTPVGSWRERFARGFKLAAGSDTVSMTVTAEHDVAVWSDTLGVLYHDGQIRLQVSDLVVRQAASCPPATVPWFGLYALVGATTGFDGMGAVQAGVGLRIKQRFGLALVGSTAGRAGLQMEVEL